MNRYVVLVKPRDDDHPNAAMIYGFYTSRAKADWFASKINEKIEAHEARDFERAGGHTGNESSYGWAYVKAIRKPVVVQARRLAIHGADAIASNQETREDE